MPHTASEYIPHRMEPSSAQLNEDGIKMSSPSHESSRSTGEVRALRIGVLGGSVAAVALALILFAFLFLWGQAFKRAEWFSDDVEAAIAITLCVLTILILVVLSITGYRASSEADTRPGRSGVIAAGVVGVVHFIVLAGMSMVSALYGQIDSSLLGIIVLGVIVLVASLAGGVVMLGVAVGVHQWNRDGQ